MTVRDDIRQALYDAIGWQNGLVEAWQDGSPEQREAIDQIKIYRKILKRRYGEGRLPDERLLDGARLVNLDEIKELPPRT
jgi:hypothetical protein